MSLFLLTALICATSPAISGELNDGEAAQGGQENHARRDDPRVVLYRLENGLEVMLAPDPRKTKVAVNIWYHVGADHEPRNQRGIAHLAEHLMFEGSAHVGPGEHVRRLREIGTEALNAHTGRHRTRYLTTTAPEALETVLWLEADRMGFVLEGLSPAAFERERAVVLRELRERVDLAAYGLAEVRLWELLFPPRHPYHTRIEGIAAHLEALDFDDVERFIRRWYGPTNATVVITGRFDVDHARRLIDRYFGTLPASRHPRSPIVRPVRLTRQTVAHHEEPVGRLPAVVIAWHGPPPGSSESVLAAVTAELLGAGGTGGLLHARLVRELEIADRISVVSSEQSAQSVFRIRVVGRAGTRPERLLEAVDEILEEIGRGELPEVEVARARGRLLTRRAAAMDGASGLVENAERVHRKRRGLLPRICVPVEALNLSNVSRFVRESLSADRRAVVLATPSRKASMAGASGDAEEMDG